MRGLHRWLPMLGWCAATLTGVAVASVALVPVLRTATSTAGSATAGSALAELPGELPYDDRDAGRLASTSPTAGAPPAAATPPTAGASSTAAPPRRVTPTPSGASGGSQPTASRRAPASPAVPSPSPTSSATTTTDDGWTVTRHEGGETTYLRSFHLEGGRCVIRASGGVVEVVSATPSAGFAVAVVQDTPDNLAVYFNEVNHSFIVHVVWQDGRPVAMVSEVGS